jgi:hypothetical protein
MDTVTCPLPVAVTVKQGSLLNLQDIYIPDFLLFVPDGQPVLVVLLIKIHRIYGHSEYKNSISSFPSYCTNTEQHCQIHFVLTVTGMVPTTAATLC